MVSKNAKSSTLNGKKFVKVFIEFKNVYAKFVYAVEEPFRESYNFPEIIYAIPRGENVITWIWKDGDYDYILLVNMDKSKDKVIYTFTKSSNKTCIEIMSGVNKNDIKTNNKANSITINMPYIGVVWLRGYDSEEICDKIDEVDPKNLPDRHSSHTLLIVLLISIFVFIAIIVRLVLFLYFKKK